MIEWDDDIEYDQQQPSITCPRCGMTSYNPNDIREGYCGNCHDWTSEVPRG
jgi:ribosomal protein L37E